MRTAPLGRRGRVRTARMGPWVELPMGARSVRGMCRAEIDGGDACELRRWGLRWSSLWGHGACEGCNDVGVGGACERHLLGLSGAPILGHEACEGCADMGAGTRVNVTIGALGGAPYGATKRVR
eukprot:1421822-Pyramimonas_sp.AAC.1